MTNSRNKPSVTVVILNLDGILFTRKCLESVLSSSYPNLKVLVIDNGSKIDETRQIEREFRTRKLSVIRLEKNFGFAKANNLGARKAHSKYVIFLNNDTIVSRKWIESLVKTAESNRAVAVQPKMLSALKKGYFDYAGAAGGFVDMFGFPFARGRIFFEVEKDVGQYDNEMEIMWASGAALFIERVRFLEFGGFDEDFFIYHEETDLCWRLRESGYKIFFCPDSIVYHYGSGYTSKDPPRKIFLLHRNMWLMTFKHFGLKNVFIRPFFDLASVFLYLFHGQVKQMWSVFLTYIWLISNLEIVNKKVKMYKPIPKDGFLYGGSIVFDYYVLGKRKFSDLKL